MKREKLKKAMATLLIAATLFALTGCGKDKFVNTKDSGSYITLNSGYTSSSGSGKATNVYVMDVFGDKLKFSGNLTYNSNGASIKNSLKGTITISAGQLSVSSTKISHIGYTYKKQ